jgi:serine/threonine-protein kinase
MSHRAPELSWTIPRPGETIAGKYVVDGQCGRGGLAVVLSATHTALDQRVAIKMLLPEWAGDPDVIERFLREGRAATRIRSEHVVRVFDVGTLDSGAPFLVLEYLEGHNLDDVLGMWGPLPVPTAIDWVLQAAEAIGEAHAYGIVHRDLKPGNLFLTRRADGSACIKVIDFGLSKITDPRMRDASAKHTRPTDVMGSPHYMAPEQLRATCDADARADLWALGAVLYQLLTGRPPFRGENLREVCAGVLTQPPPPIAQQRNSVPPAVEQAVLRCLEKEPDARFGNLADLARAIAPFGSPVARTSRERIERTLEGGVPSDLSLLPPPPREDPPMTDSWPDATDFVPRSGGASVRTILGAFLVLAGVGAAILMWMYESVHSSQPATRGVTAPQATGSTTAAPATTTTASAVPSATATSPATSTATPSATVTAPAHPVWKPRPMPAAPPHASMPPASSPHAAAPARTSAPSPAFLPTPASTAAPASDDLFDGRK